MHTPTANAGPGPEATTLQTPDAHRDDVIATLRAYHLQQLRTHLVGPFVSLAFHVIALVIVALTMTQRRERQPVTEPVVVTVMPLPIDFIDDPPIDPPPDEVVVDTPEVGGVETEIEPMLPPPTSLPGESTFAPDEITLIDTPEAATTMDPVAALDTLAMSETPLKMPVATPFPWRSPAHRDEIIGTGKVPPKSEPAVRRALAWLARVQSPDGSWFGSQAHTGMALLVFLAHSETPTSELYGTTVQNGMRWLATNVMTQPGAGNPYEKGIATYALAEAYGMTRIPMLKVAMERGVSQIVAGQQPGGGFNYNYEKGDRWDLSVSGWQFQALKAANAAGSDHPDLHHAVDQSVAFLKNRAYANKKFGYASPGSGGNMTGVGTVSLQLFGEMDSREARSGAETISKERLALYKGFLANKADFKKDAGAHIYGWYYDTQAMFNLQSRDWIEWNKVFNDVLVKNQDRDGYWEVDKGPGMGATSDKERLLSTCWAVLQLEVYYRNLPTFNIKHTAAPATAARSLDGDGVILKIR